MAQQFSRRSFAKSWPAAGAVWRCEGCRVVEEDVSVGSPVERITRDVVSGLYRNGRV